MYAARFCKACLRASDIRSTASRGYASVAAIGNLIIVRGESYSKRLLSFRRGQFEELWYADRKAWYSTRNDDLDSNLEDDCKVVESAGEPILAPPEELMQSLDAEDQRNLKVLCMELEGFRQTGCPIPKKMTTIQWQEVMGKRSRYQRLNYYRYLCITESRIENRNKKQAIKAQELEVIKEERERNKALDPLADERQYCLSKNTIFLRLYRSTMNHLYNSRQCQAIMFGQPIVVDLGYDEHMARFELNNCAKQIRDLYGFNKKNRNPFNLHFCNAGPGNTMMPALEGLMPNLKSKSCLTTVTEKSYLEIFPKEKLVYLTPHCRDDLVKYDHDAVYIIGGFVDKTNPLPVSLAKAKREGIPMKRLPLDIYLDWGDGSKCLTLDQVMKIMLDIKNTGSWKTAFQHIPKRKLKEEGTNNLLVQNRFRKTPKF